MKNPKTNSTGAFSAHALKAMLVAAVVAALTQFPGSAQAQRSYSFAPLAFLGGPEPLGSQFTFDFEPGGLNNSGQAAFGADLTLGGEGVFLWDRGQARTLARIGDPAPGGGTYGFAFYGEVTINDDGDVPFVFQLEPPTFIGNDLLFGDNAGLFLYSHRTRAVRALKLPGDPAPGGGTFHGFGFRAWINNAGDVAFAGIVTPIDIGPGSGLHLGQGIFLLDRRHHLSSVVRPGDPAPGGKTFDFAQIPTINDSGDIAFGGHVMEDPCTQFHPSNIPGAQLFCAESVYFWPSGGRIESVAHIGDPAPGGGTFNYAFGSKLNNCGVLAFFGALPAAQAGAGHLPLDSDTGIFVRIDGVNAKVARPGDSMPGGGKLGTAGFLTLDLGINNGGAIAFTALLDTATDGISDTGIYKWENGVLKLVARAGTVLPGVGTIKALQPPDTVGSATYPNAGAAINDRGQI
ncbi:MAG TPA: choice-of-anchor tandem repeat NxxGxxAF-containing protein, partial [Candidatus Binatia bacterium]|nr:choice-of-anchor tandem repeat NxxGxxAF-containing protein [Candidatus Binatia bacterium]